MIEVEELFIYILIMYLTLIGIIRIQYWSIIKTIENIEEKIEQLKEHNNE